MSIVFSRSCQHAIRAVIYLSREQNGRSIHVREISDALGIPHHFLGKVLQILTRDGIVTSAKGANGGFRLARPAHEIRLMDIVQSVDGPGSIDGCILGFPVCRDDGACPMHEGWKESREIITGMLRGTLVDELTEHLVPATPGPDESTVEKKPAGRAGSRPRKSAAT